jgi:hypothetical protein
VEIVEVSPEKYRGLGNFLSTREPDEAGGNEFLALWSKFSVGNDWTKTRPSKVEGNIKETYYFCSEATNKS